MSPYKNFHSCTLEPSCIFDPHTNLSLQFSIIVKICSEQKKVLRATKVYVSGRCLPRIGVTTARVVSFARIDIFASRNSGMWISFARAYRYLLYLYLFLLHCYPLPLVGKRFLLRCKIVFVQHWTFVQKWLVSFCRILF